MQIQTLSIVTGTDACNARCPFCVSRMTGSIGVKPQQVSWRNFDVACRLATRAGVTTAMLTGKGEPTLWPSLVTEYLARLRRFEFPIVELQTNGIAIADGKIDARDLARWYELGLTTVAVSTCHFDPERNREIYTPHRDRYIDLPALFDTLHRAGFSVRLTCVMAGGYIDGVERLREEISFARDQRVEQLTVCPVARPSESHDVEAAGWVGEHGLSPERIREVQSWLAEHGHCVLELAHGARVYDVGGQNVCFNFCLDARPEDLSQMRNLIFFPDGRIRHRWEADGAVIL